MWRQIEHYFPRRCIRIGLWLCRLLKLRRRLVWWLGLSGRRWHEADQIANYRLIG